MYKDVRQRTYILKVLLCSIYIRNVARVPWKHEQWLEARAIVKEIEDDYSLSNEEIQEKILEILREYEK